MLRIDLDVGGLESQIMRLDIAPVVIGLETERALLESAGVVKAEVMERTPVVTGRLLSSIDLAAFRTEARIWTRVHYAPFVEAGRGPITARRTRALGPMRGIGFRRSVRGAEGRHMFREGLRASMRQIQDAFRDAAHRITGFIASR